MARVGVPHPEDTDIYGKTNQTTVDDGTQLNGIFEQDPHVLSDGRIISAAHFQPGLHLCPIYTDDPTGRTGWKRGDFRYTDNGTQSAELEPSFFQQHDGTLVMVARDQNGSFKTLAATSNDRGETWTKSVKTQMPDSRAKQCAGNLPDGTVYYVNNPGRVTNASNTTWRVPLKNISLNTSGESGIHTILATPHSDHGSENHQTSAISHLYNLSGQRVTQTMPGRLYIRNGQKFMAK